MSRVPACLVLAAALLAAAPAAPARAPSATEQGAMDSLLRRLQREREEDQKAPVTQDPAALYQDGYTPLEEWTVLATIIKDKKKKQAERERATTALIKRFQMEETRTTEMGRVDGQRKAMLRELLPLMLDDDPLGRQCIHRLTQPPTAGLLKEGVVSWSTTDSTKRRTDAHKALRKLLSP